MNDDKTGSLDLYQLLEKTPLEKLDKVFEILARRVFEHRLENGGYVPLSIFPHCVGIGSVYPCVEIVVELVGVNEVFQGYYLKKRDRNKEQGWEEQWQIPGQIARITDGPNCIFNRLAEEIFGNNVPNNFRYRLEFVGIEIHQEYEERKATCWTAVWKLKIKDDSRLSGRWKLFKPEEIDQADIISHHQDTLRWVISKSQTFIRLS